MSVFLRRLGELCRAHILGMTLFSLCTGVAGNYVYDKLKSEPIPRVEREPTLTFVSPVAPTPRSAARFEMVSGNPPAQMSTCRVEPLRAVWQNVKYVGGCLNGFAEGMGTYTAEFQAPSSVTRFTVKGRFSGGKLFGNCSEVGSGSYKFDGECRDNQKYKGRWDTGYGRIKDGEFRNVAEHGSVLWNGTDRAVDFSYGFHIIDGNPYSRCAVDRMNESNCTTEERERILGR